MLSTAKSANVGFSQVPVVQLFAPPTNPPTDLHRPSYGLKQKIPL